MKTIELANARCRVTLTPENGGKITSFRSIGDGPKGNVEGPELVGGNQLQLWIKVGEHHDSAAKMLHLFHGLLHQKPTEARVDGNTCELTSEDAGVAFRRRFTLDPELPVLDIHADITNTGKEPLNLQIECSFNWSFGAASSRNQVLTTVINKDGTRHVHLPPYGDIRADLFDADGGSLALCDVENLETLLITSLSNMKRFTIYQMAGSNWRGPYSVEKKLVPGESLDASLRLSVVAGAGAVGTLKGNPVVGILPDRDVWFTDEAVTATVAAARLKAGEATKTPCIVSIGDGDGEPILLPTNGTAYTGASERLSFGPKTLRPGDTEIKGVFDRQTLHSPIRVLDHAAPSPQPMRFAPKPAFPVRALHLILSQQANNDALTLDALKWFVEHAVAPAGYSHVIWELNSTLELQSHPELAADFHFTAKQITELARFTRAMGMEPIPQQNLYGHQHETNLVKAHPELIEVPGDTSVYCPTHPGTRVIVDEIVGELLDIFEAKLFHMGHDEVQFQGMPQKIGVCPRCRAHKPHEVFALDVNAISAVARKGGARCVIWGDLLIPPSCGGQNVNGGLGEIHNALDLIPRDTIIADWHYFPTENYQSTNYFLARGHEVWDAVWFYKEGIRRFALHGEQAHATGMIFTTWCRPDMASVPIESMLYAGQCFHSIDAVGVPEIDDKLMIASHRLWREWVRWNSRRA